MGFFDLPLAEEAEDENLAEAEEYAESRWLAGSVLGERFIGRSEQGAVAVRRIRALPDRFEVELVAWVRKPRRRSRYERFRREVVLAAHGPWEHRDENGAIVDELVRFGVQFPDGARATNIDREHGWPDATEPMHGMSSHGGSASAGEAKQLFWIWPIPSSGDIILVCEWPAYGIGESRLTIDGGELRAAAASAQQVWPAAAVAATGSREAHDGARSGATAQDGA